MTDRDQLRDRIARALAEWNEEPWDEFAQEGWGVAADAVLDALQLEQVGHLAQKFPWIMTGQPERYEGITEWVPVYIVREADIPPGEEHPS